MPQKILTERLMNKKYFSVNIKLRKVKKFYQIKVIVNKEEIKWNQNNKIQT